MGTQHIEPLRIDGQAVEVEYRQNAGNNTEMYLTPTNQAPGNWNQNQTIQAIENWARTFTGNCQVERSAGDSDQIVARFSGVSQSVINQHIQQLSQYLMSTNTRSATAASGGPAGERASPEKFVG